LVHLGQKGEGENPWEKAQKGGGGGRKRGGENKPIPVKDEHDDREKANGFFEKKGRNNKTKHQNEQKRGACPSQGTKIQEGGEKGEEETDREKPAQKKNDKRNGTAKPIVELKRRWEKNGGARKRLRRDRRKKVDQGPKKIGG